MKRLLFTLTIVLLAACGGAATQPQEVEVTRIVTLPPAEVTAVVEVTRIVTLPPAEVTAVVEVTRVVTQPPIEVTTEVEVTHVVERVVTATPPPTAEPTVAPTMPPDPLKLVSETRTQDEETTYIIGAVKNVTDQPLESTTIKARFRDSEGVFQGKASTYTAPSTVLPGKTVPFILSASDSKPEWEYTLGFEAREGEPITTNIEWISYSGVPERGHMLFVGEVINQHDEELRFVEATFVLYDEGGQIVDKCTTYTDPSDLAPGDSSVFETSCYPDFPGYDHYEIVVIGSSASGPEVFSEYVSGP